MDNNEDNFIYNKILLYYDIADKINSEILKLKNIDPQIKFYVLVPIVDNIKKSADILMEQYILFLKDKTNIEIKNKILETLDDVLNSISLYKNKLYDIYKNI